MLFDYLTASVAQKLADLGFVEFWALCHFEEKIAKKNFFFQQILIFSTKFKAIYISEFLRNTNDQVAKKHLHDQENASGNISWPHAHFRARCARLKWALGSKISHFVFFHNMSVARGARARSRARPKLWNSDSSWKVEQKHTWTLFHISKIEKHRSWWSYAKIWKNWILSQKWKNWKIENFSKKFHFYFEFKNN